MTTLLSLIVGGKGVVLIFPLLLGWPTSLVINSPNPVDLVPKGKLQAYLRCQAAKEIRASAADYHLSVVVLIPSPVVAAAGHWADSVSLLALATTINAAFRIWTWDRNLSRWQMFVLGPKAGKKKKAKSDKIIWLRLQLMDHHYQWLRPTSSDFRLDSCVSSNAYIQRTQQFDADSVDPLRGAGVMMMPSVRCLGWTLRPLPLLPVSPVALRLVALLLLLIPFLLLFILGGLLAIGTNANAGGSLLPTLVSPMVAVASSMLLIVTGSNAKVFWLLLPMLSIERKRPFGFSGLAGKPNLTMFRSFC